MSRKKIMVSGGAVGFDTGATISGGTFTITSVPSLKMIIDGKGVYAGSLAWSFMGGNGPGAAPGTVMGSGSINSTAASVKVDGDKVILESDSVTATFNGTAPNGAPISFPGVSVKVTDAGQSVVMGD